MPYGVVAPGIRAVYEDFSSVKRIMALYPYPKFRKFKTDEDAWNFVKRYQNKHVYAGISKYGDTFDTHYVKMEYFIGKNALYYNFRTSKIGYIKVISNKAVIQNRTNLIMARVDNISLNSEMITAHLIAIYHGLQLLGDFIDVDVSVPAHSIFYTLMTYSGYNKVILRVLEQIRNRLGKLSVSLPDMGEEDYDEE